MGGFLQGPVECEFLPGGQVSGLSKETRGTSTQSWRRFAEEQGWVTILRQHHNLQCFVLLVEKILLTPSIPACQVPSVEFSFVDTADSKGISEETVCLANVNRLIHNMHLQSTTSLEPGPAGNQYAVCVALASQLRLGQSYRERGGGCPTIMNPNVSMIVFFPLVLILIISRFGQIALAHVAGEYKLHDCKSIHDLEETWLLDLIHSYVLAYAPVVTNRLHIIYMLYCWGMGPDRRKLAPGFGQQDSGKLWSHTTSKAYLWSNISLGEALWSPVDCIPFWYRVSKHRRPHTKCHW